MPDAGRVAIIPARGGSKRIPNKNVRPFFGHPMLAYAVASARNSALFERVVVSTDDPDAGRIAEWYGAEYLHRPPHLATDKADLIGVAEHVLESLAADGFRPAALCQLMPNCPLRRADDVRDQHRLFADQNRLFQISVVTYRGLYPHWAQAPNAAGIGRWLFGRDFSVGRSQDLETVCCPTGAVWWARVPDFLRQRKFYGEPYHLAPMDDNRGIDIDRADDLDLADLLVRGLHARDGVSPLEPIDRSPFPG